MPDIADTGVPRMTLQLTALPSTLLTLPPYVTTLNLTNLNLTHVPSLPKTVENLDLSRNKIEIVPQWVWNRSLNLNLAENPLLCECGNTEGVILIQKNKYRVGDYENVTCSDGAAAGQKDASALCDVQRATTLATLLAVSLILAALAAALLYRYRLELQVLLYRRGWCLSLLPKEEADYGKKYDVFVSFALEDEKFVREEILPKLEGRYSVHVQDRDWVVGNTIPAEIHRSVEESRRTLILLSPSFCKSMWAAEEFRSVHAQAAADRRMRAVVVLLDVNKRDIDKDTKTLLSLSALLKYDEVLFWDKLRYALPRREARGEKGAVEGGEWKERGLHVVLNDEGKLINRGYVKDMV